jgi:hypothetical protein
LIPQVRGGIPFVITRGDGENPAFGRSEFSICTKTRFEGDFETMCRIFTGREQLKQEAENYILKTEVGQGDIPDITEFEVHEVMLCQTAHAIGIAAACHFKAMNDQFYPGVGPTGWVDSITI